MKISDRYLILPLATYYRDDRLCNKYLFEYKSAHYLCLSCTIVQLEKITKQDLPFMIHYS